MRETMRKNIGGNEYIVTQWGARKAALTKIHILHLVASKLDNINIAGASDSETGIAIMTRVLGALDERTADELISRLITGVSVNTGTEHTELTVIMDDLLAGKTSDLYKILYFILEVNYPDFLGAEGVAGRFITKLKTSHE